MVDKSCHSKMVTIGDLQVARLELCADRRFALISFL